MIIDCHAHVWSLATGEYGWLGEERWGPIRRDFTLDDLHREMVASAVDQVILVHAADTMSELDRMVAAAEAHDWVVAVVAGGNAADLEQVRAVVRSAASGDCIVGFRHMTGWGEGYRDSVGSEAFYQGARLLADAGLAVELHVTSPIEMGWARDLADRVPSSPIIINHLGKPPISQPDPAAATVWREQVKAVSEAQNVSIKFSGWAPPEVGSVTSTLVRPYLDDVVAAFGSERIMFGSNWPTTLVAADYATVTRESLSALASYSPVVRDDILARSAARTYRLKTTHAERRVHVPTPGPEDAPAAERP